MNSPVLFPIRTQGFDPVMRLVADLAAAHTRGQDLGSRVPHIQAGSERVMELSRTLGGVIDDLEVSLNKLGLFNQAAIAEMREFVDKIQNLSKSASNLFAEGERPHS